MKVVLDTNVIIAGLLFPGGPPDRIVRALFAKRIQNATSPDLLTELRRIITKKFSLPQTRASELIELIAGASELVYPIERLGVVKGDETDNRVVECAVTAKADMIVTGDKKHLLKLTSILRIPVIAPADFVHKTGML